MLNAKCAAASSLCGAVARVDGGCSRGRRRAARKGKQYAALLQNVDGELRDLTVRQWSLCLDKTGRALRTAGR